MTYIFMDESGDLGFDFKNSKTTKYFLISFLICEDIRPLGYVMKRTFQHFNKKQRIKHLSMFHASKELDRTKLFFYKYLLKNYKTYSSLRYLYIFLDKRNYFKSKKSSDLYGEITLKLLELLYSENLGVNIDDINLIVSDRNHNKRLNNKFKNFIFNNIKQKFDKEIEIQIKNPINSKGLQVADGISWGIFQKYENNDDRFLKIIKEMELRKFLFK